MTSRSGQYISSPWDARLNHWSIRDLGRVKRSKMFSFRNASPSYLQNLHSYHHTIIRAAFVCVFVCFLSPDPPRSFGRSSPNLVGVCRWTSHLPLRGSFSKRSRGWWVNGSLSLSTILYMRQPHSTRCNGAFCFAVVKQQSLILRLFLQCISTLYVGAHRNCYWGVLFLKGQRDHGSMGQTGHISTVYVAGPRNCLEGFFFEKVNRSTGQRLKRLNRSTGQRVKQVDGSTGHFHFHYIIYDSRWRQAHATPLQKAHAIWWHQAHATPLQKAHSVFCSLDG